MTPAIYDTLAVLLSYPDEQTLATCMAPANGADGHSERCEESAFSHAIASELLAFHEAVCSLSVYQLQELFIQTFDLSPVCSLEMGWHLFGENYDRGLLLVKMREHLRAHGLAESTELPDHLTHGLRLLSRMDREGGGYFAEAIVLPALQKMREALQGKNNPYEHVLEAARLAVRADFPDLPAQLTVPAGTPELRVLA